MPVYFGSDLQPRPGIDTYLVQGKYLKGSFSVFDTFADVQALDRLNIELGQIAYVKDDDTYWKLTTLERQNSGWVIEWTPWKIGSGFERQSIEYITNTLTPDNYEDFELELGKSCNIYTLKVDKPCTVKAYSTPDRDENENPYIFVASADNLVDTGLTWLSNGNILKNRRYSILANLENPPTEKIYFSIVNNTFADAQITLQITFLRLE